MAEFGRAGAASTGDAIESGSAGERAADDRRVTAKSVTAKGANANSAAVNGVTAKSTAAKSTAADSVTVVLRGADTARVRMPTPAERTYLGLDPDVPVWEISRAGGGTELYPGDTTVVVPAG